MIKNSLTAKQKRFLKALGSQLDPVVQIGKSGLTPEVVSCVSDVLKARELVKVKVLQNCQETPEAVITMLAERTDTNLVQLIGRNGLLYKKNWDKPKLELPR